MTCLRTAHCVGCPIWFMSLVVVVLLGGGMHRRIIKMEGKAKVVAAGLGDVTLMPHYNHLAARMIRRKVFWENIYFGRVPIVGVL